MCGISGIYHPGDRPDRWESILQTMTRSLLHRGPDEDGFFRAPAVSLGMRRLKVMDLTTGSQPISNEDGTVHVVFNGEIYRFEQLRQNLQAQGHHFKTTSDTEVIVHLYEQYGLRFFDHFDGMFAFALWDSRRQRLIIGRDRFGIKPLFYTVPQPDGIFGFASELRPLLLFPGLSMAMDPVALNQFFTQSYILHPRSIYQGIRKLAPGAFLLAEKDSIQELQYWDLPTTPEFLNMDDAAQNLDAALESSVQAMMRSDVSVGAFLSGGLDSSTVVFHMAQHNRRVKTFSVRFSEGAFDEGETAQLISQHLNTEHHEIYAKPEDVSHLPAMVQHFGEPFADPSQIPTYLVSRLARQQVTVVLSGDGGDELLGGYKWYRASLLAAWLHRWPAAQLLLGNRNFHSDADLYRSFTSKSYKFFAGFALAAVEHHSAWTASITPHLKQRLYTPQFTELLQDTLHQPVLQQWEEIFNEDGLDPLLKYQYLDIKTYLVDNNLTKVDRMSMAHSLEVRVPFLDQQVALTALRLPLKARLRFGETKSILRRIMRGRLPSQVLAMPKKGFAVPLGRWFRQSLAGWLQEQLHPDRIRRTGVLRPEMVNELIAVHLQGKADLSRPLWNLLCFCNWFEQSKIRNLV